MTRDSNHPALDRHLLQYIVHQSQDELSLQCILWQAGLVFGIHLSSTIVVFSKLSMVKLNIGHPPAEFLQEDSVDM